MGKHKLSPDDSCQFCPFCLQRLTDTNLTLVQHSSFEFNVKTSTADTVSSFINENNTMAKCRTENA